jgi:hypothetical protein
VTAKNHLAALHVSRRIICAARSRRRGDDIAYRRKKLIAHLEEQIELARLALKGEAMELMRKRGHNLVKVRPRLWWCVEDDGHCATVVCYNNVALNFGGRGTTIEVGPLRKLAGVYQTVIRAVKAGELDLTIDAARGPR